MSTLSDISITSSFGMVAIVTGDVGLSPIKAETPVVLLHGALDRQTHEPYYQAYELGPRATGSWAIREPFLRPNLARPKWFAIVTDDRGDKHVFTEASYIGVVKRASIWLKRHGRQPADIDGPYPTKEFTPYREETHAH
jgi:hypothetical protein